MPIWITVIQWLSRFVLIILMGLSIWSVATMITCSRKLTQANGPSESFGAEMDQVSLWIQKQQWDTLKNWATQGNTLYKGTLKTLLQSTSGDSTQLDRGVRSYLSFEKTKLEEGLTVLATLGSNAPFIGLFGTVLGIIQAFGALGAHQNNTADIMVGISEALIATAVGLFVAIPAVVAYNVFSRKLKVVLVRSEALKDLYLASKGA